MPAAAVCLGNCVVSSRSFSSQDLEGHLIWVLPQQEVVTGPAGCGMQGLKAQ